MTEKFELTDDMLKCLIEFCDRPHHGGGVEIEDMAAKMIIKELLSLRERTRWIPVTEKLPDEIEVLVFDGDDNIFLAILSDGQWTTDGYDIDVTHWMPLPEIPREVKA